MTKYLCLILFLLSSTACAPDYPNDERHREADEEECADCHVYGNEEAPDAPPLTERHFKDGALKEDCKDCHSRE